VVDNDSKDDSAEVARGISGALASVGQERGLAPALNRGAAMAVGDFSFSPTTTCGSILVLWRPWWSVEKK